MTSRSLFFKMMRENTKQRLWIVALITLCFFFLFPVQTALSINGYLSPENLSTAYEEAEALRMAREELSKHFMSWCAAENGVMVTILMMISAACGLSGFSYLHSKKKVDFYHSLPIRRELLFMAILVNGFLYTAVPYLVCMMISAVMLQGKGVELLWGQLVLDYLIHMAFYFLIYVTAVTAALMTGNIVVSGLGTLVFYLWGPGVSLLCGGYFSVYFKTWYYNDDMISRWIVHSSPAAWYVSAAGSKTPGRMALWALGAGALLLGIAVFLYRKRPSEAAGRAMAFKISQPVFKFLLTIPSSLLGALVFFSVTNRDGWAVFGLLCGLILSSCVIEIIYNFDFKRMFAHKRQLLGCAVCSAVIFAFFRFDLGGYDSYLPSRGRVETAGIYCDRLEPNVQNRYHVQPRLLNHNSRMVEWKYFSVGELADMMELVDTETILEIAESGIADAAENRRYVFGGSWREHTGYYDMEPTAQWGRVVIVYHLTNGKTVYRNYNMNLSAVAGELDAVYDMAEYKTAVYPVLSWQPEDIAGVNYQECGELSHVSVGTEELKRQLLLTYQKELRALKSQTRKQESPVAAIQFKTLEMQEMIDRIKANDGNYSDFNRYLYFPIYPSFTETIALLKQCGTKTGSVLTVDTVEKIVLDYQGSNWKELEDGGVEDKTEVITDKRRLREILNSTVSTDLNVADNMNPTYWGVDVKAYVRVLTKEKNDLSSSDLEETARLEKEERWTEAAGEDYMVYDLRFDADQVPEFVKEAFGLTDELIETDCSMAY